MRTLFLAFTALCTLACAGLPVAPPEPAGVPLAPAPEGAGTLAISPDLLHALHASKAADGWTVTLDGRELAGPVDAVGPMGFTADGVHHASYKRGNAWYVVIGDRRMGPYEAVGKGVTSGDGHASFQAKRRGRWHTVVDGDEGASWVQTSPALVEGGHAAWLGTQDERTVVLVDGREVATAEEAFLGDLTGGHLAWKGRKGDTWRAIRDREPLPGEWARVGPMAQRGEDWAFAGQRADGWWVVSSDGERRGPMKDTGPVAYDVDGALIWYEGQAQGWRLHVGDWAGPVVPEIGASEIVSTPRGPLWWAQGRPDAVYVGDQRVGEALEVSSMQPWLADGQPAWTGRVDGGWSVFVGDWHTPPAQAVARAVTEGPFLATVDQGAEGWGVTLYRIGSDAPVGRWRGDVASDFGGGVRFVEGELWFTVVDDGQVVRRGVKLAPEA